MVSRWCRLVLVVFGVSALTVGAVAGCGESTGGEEWSIEDEGESEPPSYTDEWTELKGVLGGNINGQIDGRHFATGRGPFFRAAFLRPTGPGPAEYVATDDGEWRPVNADGLEGLVADAYGVSYAETDESRYLARGVESSDEDEMVAELYKAPKDSQNFVLVDTFEGDQTLRVDVPGVVATGDDLFALIGGGSGLGASEFRLLRWVGDSWTEVSVQPETVKAFLGVREGTLVFTGTDSGEDPHLYRYDSDEQTWSAQALPRSAGSTPPRTFTIDDSFVRLTLPRRSGPRSGTEDNARPPAMVIVEGDSVEEITIDSARTITPFGGMTVVDGRILALDDTGELLQITPETGQVEDVVTNQLPVDGSIPTELWHVGDKILAQVAGSLLYERTPGSSSGWTRTGMTRLAPTTLRLRNGRLWGKLSSTFLAKQPDDGNWALVDPPQGGHDTVRLTDGRTFAYSAESGCLYERGEDGWTFRLQLLSMEEARLTTCDETATDGGPFVLQDIEAYDGGLVMNVDGDGGYGSPVAVEFQQGDRQLTRLGSGDQYPDLTGADLDVVSGELWVAGVSSLQTTPNRASLLRFESPGEWERIRAPVVDASGDRVTVDDVEIRGEREPGAAIWARVRPSQPTSENRNPTWRVARWSPADEQIELLPPPGQSGADSLQAVEVTDIGPVVATDEGIFLWDPDNDAWQEISTDLPVTDASVLSIVADAERLVVRFDNESLWEVSVEGSG